MERARHHSGESFVLRPQFRSPLSHTHRVCVIYFSLLTKPHCKNFPLWSRKSIQGKPMVFAVVVVVQHCFLACSAARSCCCCCLHRIMSLSLSQTHSSLLSSRGKSTSNIFGIENNVRKWTQIFHSNEQPRQNVTIFTKFYVAQLFFTAKPLLFAAWSIPVALHLEAER